MVQVRHYCAFLILFCSVALSCSVSRPPSTAADPPPATAGDPRPEKELLSIRAQVLRAEDRRIVDDDLRSAAADPSAEIRFLAARAMGRIGEPSVLDLLTRLLEDPAPAVRAEAALAQGWIGDETSVPALIGAATDPSPLVRTRSADALGLLRDPRSTDALTTLIEDPEPMVVTAACYAVTRFAKPEFAVETLLRSFTKQDPAVAIPVAHALARIAARPLAVGATTKQRIREGLIAQARSSSAELRMLIALALYIPDSIDQAELLGSLMTDPNPVVRIQAVLSLGFPGAPLDPFISQALADPDERVVLAAIRALGTMRGPEMIERLAVVVVHDPRQPMRREAVLQMRTVDPDRAAAMSNGLAKDEDPLLRAATATLLYGRQDAASLAIANALFDDPDTRVRDAAIPALAGAAEPLSALLGEVAGETDPRTRIAIADAAGRRLGDSSRDEADRADTLALLRKIWDPARDPARVGVAVVQAAAAGGDDPRVRAILEQGMRAANYAVRLRAIEASAELFGPEGLEPPGPATDRPLEEYEEILRWAERPRAAMLKIERPGYAPELFSVRLDTKSAPLTSWRFEQLASEGAYDGVEIRRVVPNFAAQSGALREIGGGEIEATIRDEFASSLFLPGTLAMSDGGEDASRGQWFVTLTPQPQLTGRFTPFGNVVQNFDGVAALLLPGDQIVLVKVYEGTGQEPLPPADSVAR